MTYFRHNRTFHSSILSHSNDLMHISYSYFGYAWTRRSLSDYNILVIDIREYITEQLSYFRENIPFCLHVHELFSLQKYATQVVRSFGVTTTKYVEGYTKLISKSIFINYFHVTPFWTIDISRSTISRV